MIFLTDGRIDQQTNLIIEAPCRSLKRVKLIATTSWILGLAGAELGNTFIPTLNVFFSLQHASFIKSRVFVSHLGYLPDD